MRSLLVSYFTVVPLVYDHYQVTLIHHTHKNGHPHFLEFHFICVIDPHGHKPHTRRQLQTGHGTTNLSRGINECNQRHGVTSGNPSTAGTQQTIERSVSEYTPEKHQAVIAMCCCVSKRPFNMVRDPLYVEEVRLLQPGTPIPHPSTVSCDVNQIYKIGSKLVKEYFSVCYL